ncbi:hypothetical protein Sbal117_1446 [Shewanella baltica OS117]|nr:hypothetical protein Sbal117_1446 [Shewanella baltica OS117]
MMYQLKINGLIPLRFSLISLISLISKHKNVNVRPNQGKIC